MARRRRWLAHTISSRGLESRSALANHLTHISRGRGYNSSAAVLPENAQHACCIVSLSHSHRARAVLHSNGLKHTISPRAQQLSSSPTTWPVILLLLLLLRRRRRKGARCLPGRTRRGSASQPSGTEAGGRADTGVRCPREEDPRVPVARRRAPAATLYTCERGEKNTHLRRQLNSGSPRSTHP